METAAESIQEHLHVRKSCGLFSFQDLTCLEVRGQDRKKLLHGILANEVEKLPNGKGNLAHLLTPKGKVQAQMVVLALPDSLRLVCEKSQSQTLEKNIRMRIFRADVQITEIGNEFNFFGLYGPKSGEILTLFIEKIVDLSHEYDHLTLPLFGQEVFVWREHLTGEVGFHLMVRKEGAQALESGLKDRREVRSIRAQALETLMMEAGVPKFGVDFNDENLSLEVNLNKAVSNSKGCYLGQETVNRMLSRGHLAKQLVGLILDGKISSAQNLELWSKDEKQGEARKPVGHITRSIYSPSLAKHIALAFLKVGFLETHPSGENLLFLQNGDQEVNSAWVELPFYRNGSVNWLSGGPDFQHVVAPHKKTL